MVGVLKICGSSSVQVEQRSSDVCSRHPGCGKRQSKVVDGSPYRKLYERTMVTLFERDDEPLTTDLRNQITSRA